LIITKLGRYLDNRRPVDYDNIQRAKGEGLLDIKQWRFAARISQRARTQIFHQAIKGIEKYEPLVLETLDRLVSRKRYTKNPVILGLCVRRLSLFYRHIMARYKRLGEGMLIYI
jgi:hypothetical protein